MAKYNCKLSFEEDVEAKNEDDAIEKFIDILDSLSSGWEVDNTEIKEVKGSD